MAQTEKWPVVSCDSGGQWLPDDVESKYEIKFMDMLHTSKSYEEFMLKSDINNAQFNAEYFGFSCIEELQQFVKDYYTSKTGFLPNGIE